MYRREEIAKYQVDDLVRRAEAYRRTRAARADDDLQSRAKVWRGVGNPIDVYQVQKVYPDGTRALDGVSFQVKEGEIFGLLGPNGAGKTTAIRIMVTLLRKTRGTVTIAGYEVDREPERIRRVIGYAGQFIGIDVDLTGRENLLLQGRLHGLSASSIRRRVDELLELFALQEVADRRAGAYSGGLRRRLDLAQALIHEPLLLFLDEPTQYLEEADRLCHRLAIIDHGRLVTSGSPQELKAEIGGEVVTVTIAEDGSDELLERARRALTPFAAGRGVTTVDRSLTLSVKEAGKALSDIVRRLDQQGVPISQLTFSIPSLDEVFLRYTGERMRAEDPSGRTSSSVFATFGKGIGAR